MSIPFFSIDFRFREALSFLCGLLPFSNFDTSEKYVKKHISSHCEGFEIELFPSARMAFYLTLKNLFKKGDEIIFPILGFPLYVKIAYQLGLVPIFVDVEKEHLLIDSNCISKVITSKTKGIVVTHLFGHPAEMDAITLKCKEHNLIMIEDCAQSYDSFYKNQHTGTFGRVGIFSSSLMKVPTTLGGGILITKDLALLKAIQEDLKSPLYDKKFKVLLITFVKNLISILNSYPLLYEIFSHHIFGLIKSRNPAMLRKILYSGMGMNGKLFDVWERPKLSSYQLKVGKVQFERTREMTEKRRHFSTIISEKLHNIPGIIILKEDLNVYWNFQYHVIGVEGRMNKIYDLMFAKGYHLMQENVWDCSHFNFPIAQSIHCPIGMTSNPHLIRIPNNSLLSEKQVTKMATDLRECCIKAFSFDA